MHMQRHLALTLEFNSLQTQLDQSAGLPAPGVLALLPTRVLGIGAPNRRRRCPLLLLDRAPRSCWQFGGLLVFTAHRHGDVGQLIHTA